MTFFFYVFPILAILVILNTIIVRIYRRFHHHNWAPDASPDENATFVKMEHTSCGVIQPLLKTTVYYSDGFIFTTFLTEYDHHLLGTVTTIKLDYAPQQENKTLAGRAHMRAVKKHLTKELKHKS